MERVGYRVLCSAAGQHPREPDKWAASAVTLGGPFRSNAASEGSKLADRAFCQLQMTIKSGQVSVIVDFNSVASYRLRIGE